MSKIVKLMDVSLEPLKSKVVVFGKITSIDEKVSGTGSKYIDFAVSDACVTIYGKSWNTELKSFNAEVGQIVKMMTEVSSYNEKAQLILVKDAKSNTPMIRPVTEEDGIDETEFIKVAPKESVTMYDSLLKTVDSFKDEEYRKIAIAVLTKYREQLLYFSGGLKVHHAYKAGLLYHMFSMVTQAIIKGEFYPEVNSELLITGCIIHDIGKLREIEVDANGTPIRYSLRGALLGHIVDGILMLDEIFREEQISEETQILLHHMIASHHYEPAWGSMSLPRFMEAELLHILDMGDSRVDQIFTATSSIKEGEFTDKVYFLGNREMYKPNSRNQNRENIPSEDNAENQELGEMSPAV